AAAAPSGPSRASDDAEVALGADERTVGGVGGVEADAQAMVPRSVVDRRRELDPVDAGRQSDPRPDRQIDPADSPLAVVRESPRNGEGEGYLELGGDGSTGGDPHGPGPRRPHRPVVLEVA